MESTTKKWIVGIVIAVAVIGAGTGLMLYVNNKRKKKNASEIEQLLLIAKNEGGLSQEGYEKFRKLIYLESYQLPTQLQNAFNKIKPLLVSAGNSIRAGYAVAAQQYFTQMRSIIEREPSNIQTMYRTVESLLQEAFKLNAASASVQQRLNSANEKSIDWWGVVGEVMFPVPSLVLKNTIMPDHSDLVYAFNKITSGSASPESRNFDKQLMGQNVDTLKLFSEAYSALSGGKDFFEIPKHPK